MDVKLPIEEDDVGINNSSEVEVKMEEDIRRHRRERMNNALAAAQTAAGQNPAEMYAAARKLADVIECADVEEFISVIETIADHTDLPAIFNFMGLPMGSLLHVAADAGKGDILLLLVDYVRKHLIVAQNDWGDIPLHLAAKGGEPRLAETLICRARDLHNVENILRMRNKQGNTALHEAVLNSQADMVNLLLNEYLEPVYWENADKKSPLYLATDIDNPMIHEVVFSLSLEPSKIQGLPPVHGAIMRHKYGLVTKIFEKNIKLFAMTDSRGGNVFHLAAYTNRTEVFQLLQLETEYLARQQDMNGDLPIHIASKMGHVNLIEKLHPVSHLLNDQGQTVLHIAAKYGQTSAVKYILHHPKLGKLVNERDHAGNTALHLASMYSQPAALIPLVLDKRTDPLRQNHKCLAALDIALDRLRREYTLRKKLAVIVLGSEKFGEGSAVSEDLLILRPEARDEAFSLFRLNEKKPNMDHVKNVINTRLLVATLVATVTFAAGFAIPGGFNNPEVAASKDGRGTATSKDDRGMAVMLDKRLFQAFAICNTIAMFCSMIAVINLMWLQQNNVYAAIAAYRHTKLPLTIALPAMSAAFLTGVTLTVGKLHWLANLLFYMGLVFVLIISGARLLEHPPFYGSPRRPIRHLISWLVLVYIYLWGVETYLLDDSEEDGTASGTSTSRQPSEVLGNRMPDDSVSFEKGVFPRK